MNLYSQNAHAHLKKSHKKRLIQHISVSKDEVDERQVRRTVSLFCQPLQFQRSAKEHHGLVNQNVQEAGWLSWFSAELTCGKSELDSQGLRSQDCPGPQLG